MKQTQLFLLITAIMLVSCNGNGNDSDASGAFEAQEIIVSAEVTGILQVFDIEESQKLAAGQLVAIIDSTQLALKKRQLEAQISVILSRRPDISIQIAALKEQLKAVEKEQTRLGNLVQQEAAPQKQLDDVNAQVEVLKKQIAAQSNVLGTTTESIELETRPMQLQISQLEDQLKKCRVTSPITGTVLTKFTEAHELAVPGKPLFKIADLTTLTLRAYFTGDQLGKVKLGQQVQVLIDEGPDQFRTLQGTVRWISDHAEFTPKTIQTKAERANLVYATKIDVPNDGTLKLGMYGEIKL